MDETRQPQSFVEMLVLNRWDEQQAQQIMRDYVSALSSCAESFRKSQDRYKRICMEAATAEMLAGQAFGL